MSESRTAHIERLYAMRRSINQEIARIEAEIDADIRAMRRAKEAAAVASVSVDRRTIAACGTDGGYYRHIRTLDEDACEACKLAHRVAERERSARRIARAEQLGAAS